MDQAPSDPAVSDAIVVAEAATPASATDAPIAQGPAVDAPAETVGSRTGGWLLELVKTIALTLVIFFAVQAFVAQPFQVNQFSMQHTFEQGDYVLVDKLSVRWDGYSRGDVVVFQPPPAWTDQPEPYIKRVIGEPGDTVEVRDDGLVYVNGVALDEPYLFRGEDGSPQPTIAEGESSWVVPAGELFVMGDHRQRSADSRAFGPIPISSVIGRGAVRYWPIGSVGFVTAPVYAGVPAPSAPAPSP